MTFFNAPLSQPEHAWLAVQTAFDIRERVVDYHKSLAEDHPQRSIQMSFGIYTGKAVVGYVDAAHRQEYTVVGETVNLATQLAALAEPGQVFINGLAVEKIAARASTGSVISVSSHDWALPFMVYQVLSTS